MIMPIYKGRKLNKILCLIFLALTLILLAAAGVSFLLDNAALGRTFRIIALITGAFTLVYALLWLLYAKKESRAEQAMNAVLRRQYSAAEAARTEYREFTVPKAELTKAARRRYDSILLWSGITALGSFLLILGIQLACGSLRSPAQAVYVLVFCLLIMVPGVLVQGSLYRKYADAVPSRILLYPGKLVVDDTSYSASAIRELRVSPDRVVNPHSPSVFRELLIRTDAQTAVYRIDYRSGTSANEQPFWAEYEAFLAALSAWGAENGVTVTVAFMD